MCDVALVENCLSFLPTDREMKRLTYREREVMRLRLGICGNSYTQDECRRIFKVSIGRIRRIEEKAIGKLNGYRAVNVASGESEQKAATRPLFRVDLRPKPGVLTDEVRLRGLLKIIGRRHGLECVDVREVKEDAACGTNSK